MTGRLRSKYAPHPEISITSSCPALITAPEMIALQTALLLLLYGEGRGRTLLPHVTAPGTWRLGVPESVFIQAFQQAESFPVKVSVVSFPDKKRTFSSALLQLTSEKHFRGAVELEITAEDSPGDFVYLLVESEDFREETRIPVSSSARTPRHQPDKTADRRRPRRSVMTKSLIQTMTSRFKNPDIRQCCLNGSDHYSQHFKCENRQSAALKRSKPNCYNAYEYCCNYTEENYRYKPMGIAYDSKESEFKHLPGPVDPPARIVRPAVSEYEEIRITVTQTVAERTVISTFTVKIDPTEDVSIQLSSKTFDTNIAVSSRTPPPANGDQ